ncbi:MAG: hypothetical protein K2J46_11160, partial [Muribaculaceae bacterium]|nr:hypothetical protein [Muribaculaceae bacterium]
IIEFRRRTLFAPTMVGTGRWGAENSLAALRIAGYYMTRDGACGACSITLSDSVGRTRRVLTTLGRAGAHAACLITLSASFLQCGADAERASACFAAEWSNDHS